MSEHIEEGIHEVHVTAHIPDGYDAKARITTSTYPDDSVVKSLDADELREVADMIIDIADRMEDSDG